jgi:hypothetical protein
VFAYLCVFVGFALLIRVLACLLGDFILTPFIFGEYLRWRDEDVALNPLTKRYWKEMTRFEDRRCTNRKWLPFSPALWLIKITLGIVLVAINVVAAHRIAQGSANILDWAVIASFAVALSAIVTHRFRNTSAIKEAWQVVTDRVCRKLVFK